MGPTIEIKPAGSRARVTSAGTGPVTIEFTDGGRIHTDTDTLELDTDRALDEERCLDCGRELEMVGPAGPLACPEHNPSLLE